MQRMSHKDLKSMIFVNLMVSITPFSQSYGAQPTTDTNKTSEIQAASAESSFSSPCSSPCSSSTQDSQALTRAPDNDQAAEAQAAENLQTTQERIKAIATKRYEAAIEKQEKNIPLTMADNIAITNMRFLDQPKMLALIAALSDFSKVLHELRVMKNQEDRQTPSPAVQENQQETQQAISAQEEQLRQSGWAMIDCLTEVTSSDLKLKAQALFESFIENMTSIPPLAWKTFDFLFNSETVVLNFQAIIEYFTENLASAVQKINDSTNPSNPENAGTLFFETMAFIKFCCSQIDVTSKNQLMVQVLQMEISQNVYEEVSETLSIANSLAQKLLRKHCKQLPQQFAASSVGKFIQSYMGDYPIRCNVIESWRSGPQETAAPITASASGSAHTPQVTTDEEKALITVDLAVKNPAQPMTQKVVETMEMLHIHTRTPVSQADPSIEQQSSWKQFGISFIRYVKEISSQPGDSASK
jgi:hypothetical protein